MAQHRKPAAACAALFLVTIACDGRVADLGSFQQDAGGTKDAAPVNPTPDAASPVYPDPTDAMVPVEPLDASLTDGGPKQVGPSYACGPSDAGLRCSCGVTAFFPAPVDDAGNQQTYVSPPDPASVVAYSTQAEFDGLAVGRWQRTAGEGELVCEQFGIEFTADHLMIPLVVASDGSVQAVTALARSFSIVFTSHGPTFADPDAGMGYAAAPTFFDSDQSMYLNYAPWLADYVRAP